MHVHKVGQLNGENSCDMMSHLYCPISSLYIKKLRKEQRIIHCKLEMLKNFHAVIHWTERIISKTELNVPKPERAEEDDRGNKKKKRLGSRVAGWSERANRKHEYDEYQSGERIKGHKHKTQNAGTHANQSEENARVQPKIHRTA